MANSSEVTVGQTAMATQYNDLRKDVLNDSSGHRHSGQTDEGRTLFGTLWTGSPAFLLDNIYQAPYDLFVIVYHSGAGSFELNVESVSPPTVPLAHISGFGNCAVPIKKGDYWSVVTSVGGGSTTIYNLQIGA
jgi:hypothetical protein